MDNRGIRTRIQDAARSVIARQGVNNATIQAIVDEAGTSKGALYHYYRSKNEILYDVMDESLKESTRVANKMHAGALPEELLDDIVSGLIKRFQKLDENRLQFYLAHEAMLGNEELRAKFSRKYTEWVDRVGEMLVGIYGVPETRLNRAVSAASIAAIDGLVMQDLMGVEVAKPEDIMEVWELALQKGLPALLKEIQKKDLQELNKKDNEGILGNEE